MAVDIRTADANGADVPAIEITGLRKVFRRRRRARVALDDLDLSVEPGQVHGFLGPNGAGKTTTIRALLGLIRADAGQSRIFGYDVPDALGTVIGSVGVVVEQSQLYPYFSARRNLRLLATVAKVDSRRVDEKLELVGLADRAKDEVRGYSLGMRQRLAIAATLLKEPSLLILDEPNNGLDPAGIREVRDLLRHLADNGVSVLLSSHILGEIQQVCDTVSIVAAGRRVVTGPVSDVLATAATGEVLVRVDDLDAAERALAEAGMIARRVPDGDRSGDGDHLIVSDMADPSWITQVLARHRLFVSELTPLAPDLESVFLELTGSPPAGHPVEVTAEAPRPDRTAVLDADPTPALPMQRPMDEAAVIRELSQYAPTPVTRPGRHAAPDDNTTGDSTTNGSTSNSGASNSGAADFPGGPGDTLESTQEWTFDPDEGQIAPGAAGQRG